MNIGEIINDNNNLVVCIFGSHLYGTANENSDTDLVIIQKEYKEINNINIHCFTLQTFYDKCIEGDIVCLECLYSDNHLKKTIKLDKEIKINQESFRRNISMLTSNSWVKGKKKLTVIGDYDLNIGLKSVFHSLRILDFAIQIGEMGKIYDFKRKSYILKDLQKLSETYHHNDLWAKINDKYRSVFNSEKSKFKVLFPIDKQTETLNEIKEILKRYNCFSSELYDELKGIF